MKGPVYFPDATVFLDVRDDARQDALIADFRDHIRATAAAGRCLEIGPSLTVSQV